MKLNSLFALTWTVALMTLNGGNAMGQPSNFDFSKMDFSSFDPAQMQKRMMEGYRKQLEITSDDEWKVIEERIQKVISARREAGSSGGMGLGGMASLFGGTGPATGTGPRGGGFGAFFPQPSPEEEALQKAFDAKASKADLKAALEKFIDARKRKQADL